jgi:hypothetical protein
MDFVYPIENDVPLSDPYSLLTYVPFTGINTQWKKPVEKVVDYISKEIIDSNNCIPVGTKLYHGSLDHNLTFSKDMITFFGIDVIISLWYILELSDMSWSSRKLGKLYEFVVTKPIPVILIKELTSNPKETGRCYREKIACIHPQITLHDKRASMFTTPVPKDLSIEVTFNMKYFKENISLKKTYLVDPSILDRNRYSTFQKFNPVKSIIEENKVGGIRNKKTRRKRRVHVKKTP